MMKKIIILLVLCAMPFLFVSCLNLQPSPSDGLIYSDFITPLLCPEKNTEYSKMGESSTISFFRIVALGDGGIKEATENGGISEVKMVDMQIISVLGLYVKYITHVYGD
jgi:hypothetical protein